jgi:hypothetical protein
VITQLCEEALGLADVVRSQVEGLGGVQILRTAVRDPAARGTVDAVLDRAGVWQLDPLADATELEAAAAVCQVAGEFALPYPVAERLARTPGGAATLLVSCREARRLGAHVDLELGWTGVDLTGATYDVSDFARPLLGTKLGPFAGEVDARLRPGHAPRVAALITVFQCWWLLGLSQAALADTIDYTGVRAQFGRPLRAFQSVGFGLADMTVAADGLGELAKYALWSVREDTDGDIALTDALSLRVAALEAAGVVMRGAHQYYGAMGFTDEVDVSWLSRASQFVRRLPDSESVTQELLAARMAEHDFDVIALSTAATSTTGEGELGCQQRNQRRAPVRSPRVNRISTPG